MKISFKILLIILFAGYLISSCKQFEYVDPYAEAAANEESLLYDFYHNTYNNKYDSILALSTDTIIDNRVSTDSIKGFIFISTEKGTGDTIKATDVVGYRYTAYAIVRDTTKSSLNHPILILGRSNETVLDPETLDLSSSDAFSLKYALRYMKKYGRCTVISSSGYAQTSYIPMVFDIRLVYVQQ